MCNALLTFYTLRSFEKNNALLCGIVLEISGALAIMDHVRIPLGSTGPLQTDCVYRFRHVGLIGIRTGSRPKSWLPVL